MAAWNRPGKRWHGLLAPTLVACLRARKGQLWFKHDPNWKFCPLCGNPLPRKLLPVPKALPDRFFGWRSAIEPSAPKGERVAYRCGQCLSTATPCRCANPADKEGT